MTKTSTAGNPLPTSGYCGAQSQAWARLTSAGLGTTEKRARGLPRFGACPLASCDGCTFSQRKGASPATRSVRLSLAIMAASLAPENLAPSKTGELSCLQLFTSGACLALSPPLPCLIVHGKTAHRRLLFPIIFYRNCVGLAARADGAGKRQRLTQTKRVGCRARISPCAKGGPRPCRPMAGR